jgi:hypothetical protein
MLLIQRSICQSARNRPRAISVALATRCVQRAGENLCNFGRQVCTFSYSKTPNTGKVSQDGLYAIHTPRPESSLRLWPVLARNLGLRPGLRGIAFVEYISYCRQDMIHYAVA